MRLHFLVDVLTNLRDVVKNTNNADRTTTPQTPLLTYTYAYFQLISIGHRDLFPTRNTCQQTPIDGHSYCVTNTLKCIELDHVD